MSMRAWKRGFRIREIPIVFVDRTEGQSKMSRAIVREAVGWSGACAFCHAGAASAPRHIAAAIDAGTGMIASGRTFYKMSGSGNDFVFFDARRESPNGLDRPDSVQRLCARGTGVGADGVVFLEPSRAAAFKIRYLNADGSLAALCGNATLCSARLAVELGGADGEGFEIETDDGVLDPVCRRQRDRSRSG